MKAFLEKIRSIDIFGHKITLTYMRKETYQTAIGAIATLTLGLLLLFYGLITFKKTINNDIKSIHIDKRFTKINDSDGFEVGKSGFKLAFGFLDS